MREHVVVRRKKNHNQPVSIPALKQNIRGFGSQTHLDAHPEITNVQLSRKPLTYDMSQVSFRPQAKLTINQPGDAYEQEADKVAQQVVGMIQQPANQQNIQREEMLEEEEESEGNLRMKPLDINILQREDMPLEDEEKEEENLQTKSIVQRQSGNQEMTATLNLENSIQQARGNGQSLPDNVREPMENAFGADFNRVKVHTDTQSHQLNESIQARAFTTGQDIFFREGAFNPSSQDGQELLAHELTHVVQQGGANTKKDRKQK